MRFSRLLLHSCLLLTASVGATLYSTVGQAAEKVVLKYGIFQESISVAELSSFAETGEPSPTLAAYMKLANKKPEEIRDALTKQVTVSAVVVDRALNNAVGERVLDEVGSTIHTSTNTANRQALRSALVLSASDDSKISLIEAIQKYPTQEVEVEGDRLVDTATKLSELESGIRKILGVFDQL
ncbi:MAG: alpha/beta hydrolase [Stenomitos rutilans HA7619-LM2]|jgi:ribosomal protein L31E|nr:alpha/beta hydrolase [Stenomitos rutilans HA7619-LM2]